MKDNTYRKVKRYVFVLGSCSVAFILGTMFVLPLWDRKFEPELEILNKISGDIKTVGDILDNDSEAYHYWYAPSDSFGIQEMRDVNWSFFKQKFNQHTDWNLEYKRYSYSSWTDGKQYLTVNKTWNDNGFWKINLTLDVPVDIFSARFTFGCNLPVLDYVERDGYEVLLNYSANNTEIYNLFFNYSDIASIPGLVITKGRTDDMFWFRFRRDNISAGRYIFDPWFGSDVEDSQISILTEDYSIIRGNKHTLSVDAVGDNISVKFGNINGPFDVTCGIYYDDGVNDAGALVGITEEKTVSVASTIYVFNFSGGLGLSGSTDYWLCLQSSQNPDSSTAAFVRKSTEVGHWYDYETSEIGWRDPMTGERNSANLVYLYCSYTTNVSANNAPTQSGESPVNQSTGVTPDPSGINCYVVVSDVDAVDTINATWYHNISGSWWEFGSNTSVSSGTNITQLNANFTNYSSTYYWSVNISDGEGGWCNESYYFTTTSRVLQSVLQGWFSGNNITVFNQVLQGWFSGNNVSSDRQVFQGWFSGNNVSASSQVLQGYFIGGNVSSNQQVFQGWFSGNNVSELNLQQVFQGWFSGGNISGDQQVLSGWFSGNNVSNSQEVLSGWFSGGNVSSLNQVLQGWFSGGYINQSRQVTSGWFSGGNISGNVQVFQGWFSGGNISLPAAIVISGEYPGNNSISIPLQPILYVTVNSSTGETMNISWYYGLTLGNETILLGTETNINNGTITELYYPATTRSTSYYWRVQANDGTNYVNETYIFLTEGDDAVGSASRIGIIGIIGIFGILGFIIGFRRLRDRK